jgi:hypothetical protein
VYEERERRDEWGEGGKGKGWIKRREKGMNEAREGRDKWGEGRKEWIKRRREGVNEERERNGSSPLPFLIRRSKTGPRFH